MSCYLPDLYTRFQVHISTQLSRKKLRKFSGGVEFCWGPLSECLWSPKGQTLPSHDEKQYSSKHLPCKCVCKIERLYIIFEAINEEKWLWPIFGCKAGQIVPIWMKLELDVWQHQNQIDISKHVEKSLENLKKKSKTNETITKILKKLLKNRTYVKRYTAGHPCTKFEEFIYLWSHDCKKWVWHTFGCKLGQSDPTLRKLILDMSCLLLNILHVEKIWKMRTDRQTDGWTLPRNNTSVFKMGV